MGDLLMSTPAIRALKETFSARITVLTSSMAAGIAQQISEIDDVILFNVPWVKSSYTDIGDFNNIVKNIKSRRFDAAVIFTVYSQNPLPTVMLAYLAGIPLRLAYCRENPYQLLTNWVPDQEPYNFIKHQVERDLDLVASVGAKTADRNLSLKPQSRLWPQILNKLVSAGLNAEKKWIILHAGVSEPKREYPVNYWVNAAKLIIAQIGCQLILTGSASEKQLTVDLGEQINKECIIAGGLFTLEELTVLIAKSPVLLSVNTGTVHIAAAVQTPVVVLYALTNPQHTPWHVPCKILPFTVNSQLQSKNEVIKHVNSFENDVIEYPSAADVLNAVIELLTNPTEYLNQELNLINRMKQKRSLV
ncbi:glycosyltransferase family 9 protein [Mucilaginibacter pineti]|nr:glycosyltransferase family 9 protein [Mucilaginibacter pineti]